MYRYSGKSFPARGAGNAGRAHRHDLPAVPGGLRPAADEDAGPIQGQRDPHGILGHVPVPPSTRRSAGPMRSTEAEVRAIRRTAEECNQELIPFLQCAGHLEYVLTREPYAGLSEGHGGYSYCLANEAVLPLAESLIDEIVAQHPGPETSARGGRRGRARHLQTVRGGRRFPRDVSETLCADRRALPQTGRGTVDVDRYHGALPIAETSRTRSPAGAGSGSGSAARGGRGRLALRRQGFLRGAKTAGGRVPGVHRAGRPVRGDVFDLPRVRLHTGEYPGRLSPGGRVEAGGNDRHQLVVPRVAPRGVPAGVCRVRPTAGTRARRTLPALLARFFRQRYGLSEADGAGLAQAALAETKENVPTALGAPTLDVKRRAWTIPAAKQADQLISRIGKEDPAATGCIAGRPVRAIRRQ